MAERVAAIDVGSNAIRFSAAEHAADGVQVVAENRWAVRLGRGVFTSGRIEEEDAAQAAEGLVQAARQIEELQVRRYRAVATSAVRESRNRLAFVRRMRQASGIHLEVIPGSEEIRLVHAAVRRRMALGRDTWAMVELGGGSVEIALADDTHVTWNETHAMGAVRLMEMFAKGNSEPQEFSRLVQEYVATLRLPGRAAERKLKGLIATGGNIESIARICRGGRGSAGPLALSVEEVRDLVRALAGMSVEERQKKYELRPDRADVIVPAGIVYTYLAEKLGASEIAVPGGGVREGIMANLLEGSGLPAQAGEDGLVEDAVALGRKFHFDEPHALHVQRMALSLFDQLADLHGLGPRERRMLAAAALLHDVGGFVSLKSHHKHALYIISRSELPGFNRREMFLAGCVARYHRKGPPTLEHREFAQLSLTDRHRVRLLAGLLRVADALDKEHRQKITAIAVDRAASEIRIRTSGADDILLEQWALQKKDDLFREAFGLSVSLCRNAECVDA